MPRIAEADRLEFAARARSLFKARFPVHTTLEGFDWSNVGFPDGWGRDEMLSLGFAAAAEDLVLHGPPGRGKTHVATALGIEATARGIPVRFYSHLSLLIVDEVGYLDVDKEGADLLFQLVSRRYDVFSQ